MKLVACQGCHRQYDTSAYPFDGGFICVCGRRLKMTPPSPRDIPLSRCAKCGATVDDVSGVCGHCASPMPVLERGRSTVCPECAVRIPGNAAFCSACGIAINPQVLLPVVEDSKCPRCKSEVRTRDATIVPMVECVACHGIWLAVPSFDDIVKRAREGASELANILPEEKPPAQKGEAHRRGLVPCLVCNDLMVPRQFGERSGVVIDVCGLHGIWLDHRELERIVAWIKSGGLQKAERIAKEDEQRLEAKARAELTEANRWGDSQSSILGRRVKEPEFTLISLGVQVLYAILRSF